MYYSRFSDFCKGLSRDFNVGGRKKNVLPKMAGRSSDYRAIPRKSDAMLRLVRDWLI